MINIEFSFVHEQLEPVERANNLLTLSLCSFQAMPVTYKRGALNK